MGKKRQPVMVAATLLYYRVRVGKNPGVNATFCVEKNVANLRAVGILAEHNVRIVEPDRGVKRPDIELMFSVPSFRQISGKKPRIVFPVVFDGPVGMKMATDLAHIAQCEPPEVEIHETQLDFEIPGAPGDEG